MTIEKKIEELLNRKSFDILMHFAGFTSVSESINHPEKYHENNFIKSKNLFKTCIKYNLNRIIFSSSASIYRNTNNQKQVNEDDKKNPKNPYSKSKMDVENHLLNLSNEKKIKTIILRYFNVAGADHKKRSGLINSSDSLIKSICEVASGKKDKLIIYGNDYNTKDGTTVRDFIHVSDLAEMHMIVADYLIRENKNDIFQFTILRNPIDRYLSEYYYNLNFDITKKEIKSDNIIQTKKLNLREYVELIKKKNYDNILTRLFSNKVPSKPFKRFRIFHNLCQRY